VYKLTNYISDNSDVTLPAVDPRTISPASNDAFEAGDDMFEPTNQDTTDPGDNSNRNLFFMNIGNDENTKIQKKLIIKEKRNIKPKVRKNIYT
jgi:hypothetical protein